MCAVTTECEYCHGLWTVENKYDQQKHLGRENRNVGLELIQLNMGNLSTVENIIHLVHVVALAYRGTSRFTMLVKTFSSYYIRLSEINSVCFIGTF